MIKELHPGDTQISAAGWNEMRAAVQGLTPGQQQYQSGQRCAAYITVKNAIPTDLPAFSVVSLGAAIYNSRTGSDFADLAIKSGVELGGYMPSSVTDTIAITQAACPRDGFVKALTSGVTACYVNRQYGVNCKYAKPSASHSDYLEGTDTPTNIKVLWVAGGTGKKEAVVRIGTFYPQQIFSVTVDGQAGDGTAYATIDGVQYPIIFPNAGLSATNYPDIYPYDQILVLLDLDSGLCYGVDYPTDYDNGTLMAFYSGQGSPGRGWDAITTPPDMATAGFTLYQKVKTDAIL